MPGVREPCRAEHRCRAERRRAIRNPQCSGHSGVQVHSADVGKVARDDPDDPMRTAMRQMAGVFAELDRAMTVKRVRDGRKAKKAKGGHPSGSYPYGFCKAGPEVGGAACLSCGSRYAPCWSRLAVRCRLPQRAWPQSSEGEGVDEGELAEGCVVGSVTPLHGLASALVQT